MTIDPNDPDTRDPTKARVADDDGYAGDQKPRPRLEPHTFSNVSAHTMHDDRLKARELRVLICIRTNARRAQ